MRPDQAYFWTEEVQKRIHQSEEDIKAGRYKDYDDVEELLKDLDDEETADSSLRSE